MTRMADLLAYACTRGGCGRWPRSRAHRQHLSYMIAQNGRRHSLASLLLRDAGVSYAQAVVAVGQADGLRRGVRRHAGDSNWMGFGEADVDRLNPRRRDLSVPATRRFRGAPAQARHARSPIQRQAQAVRQLGAALGA